MTIHDLKHKLEFKLKEHAMHHDLRVSLPSPHRLIKRLEKIESHFEMADQLLPALEKIKQAIDKFERGDIARLTKKDWLRLVWGLCLSIPLRPQKLIFLEGGKRVLYILKTQPTQITERLYVALLFSYFALTQQELRQDSNQWLVLRDLLKDNFQLIQQKSKHSKGWMQVLMSYPEVLQVLPTKRLAADFLNDTDDKKIPDIAQRLRIPTDSWFWENLVYQAVKSACELSDELFFGKIGRLLYLADTQPAYKAIILAKVLDRYAESNRRDQTDDRLKEMSLNQWDNPQYDSSVGWNNVKPETKKMVVQWFVRADLEAFFKTFNQNADERCFRYWMRYIRQISFSQLFLGPHALNSRQVSHQKFIFSNKGRYLELTGGTSTNNSFMLRIGSVYIVEFSERPNACYLYNKSPIRLNSNIVHLSHLKNKSICIGTLNHNHIPPWEESFDTRLRELGIFPDNNSSSAAPSYGRKYRYS